MTTTENPIGNSSTEIPSGDIDGQNSNEQFDPTKYVSKDEYLNAQSFGTKARQNEIAMATRLVKASSSELHNMGDEKLRDAVTKSILGMTYAEATAVMGSNFDLSNSTSSNEDDSSGKQGSTTSIEREIKLLKYKEEVREIDSAIERYSIANPSLFSGDSNKMKELIRSELSNISSSLSVDERVRRAGTVAFGNPVDKESLAYQILLGAQAGVSRNSSTSMSSEKDTKIHNAQNELRALFGLKQK